MKRLLRVLLALLFGLALVAPAATAAQAAPFCGITWGSLPKHAGTVAGQEYLTGIRAGRHACFDRLVLDVRGGRVSGYDVRYAPVATVGQGRPIPLRGAGDLRIVADVHASTPGGQVTYDPANDNEAVNVSGFRTFRQVAWGGSFEGVSVVGLGVRARLPFRAFVVTGPGTTSRLVVDVAHRW
jgi:hypothetical protein